MSTQKISRQPSYPASGGSKRTKRKLQNFHRPPRLAAHVRRPSGPGKPRVKSDYKSKQRHSKRWNKRQLPYHPAPNTFFSPRLPLPLIPYTPGAANSRRPPRPPPGHHSHPHVKSLPVVRQLEHFHLHEAQPPRHTVTHSLPRIRPVPHFPRPPSHPSPISHAFTPITFQPLSQSPVDSFVHSAAPSPALLQLTTPLPLAHHQAPVRFTQTGEEF